MSAEAKAYWINAFEKLAKLDSWQKELDKKGWDADFKSGDAFSKASTSRTRTSAADEGAGHGK